MNGSDDRTTSQQIAAALRERIRSGPLKAGDRLPTQAELAEEFAVERGTVRQAIRTLAEEGLLTNVSKGSPPRVAAPQSTLVSLAPRLSEAFAAPEVSIDAVCLTAESLLVAVGEPLRLIHEGRLLPEAVRLRVLLPGRDIALAFPAPADHQDERVHQRWLAQRNAQGQVLRSHLLELRASHGIDVQVEFRALPFTPPVKLYLLNDAEALLAFYTVARREEEFGDGTLDLYDTHGSQSLLFGFEPQAGERDGSFVREAKKWFNSLWDTISSELTLFS
ncbi:GntR family transcriptional regulator [Streptomyces sp. NPDC058045]|uniref:GntR family transcriptional regulator n=1 Tax=Streptomyces sp. NPDC058045 TaxID=3346311 RepID=UPI0036F0E7EC